ncbi:hypothetical protein [Donghicola tyrosinivorans]|uniref:Sulfotransferase family protein n=1 Tax=Donghicola tyrosinivorans TaxID=1652492 RepID=A0A2T0WZH5_9RHOB|nr:hypothetical protein [Donghicola tyrosinivorans]PRY92091.1 hypothetical protein CLV74_1022 [Donghicola tyrosinivorans]
MKIIIYIGHHKVGSTALQNYFAQNWLKFVQSGILYPAVETRGFANNLKKALGAGDQVEDLHFNVKEPHSALAYRMMADVSPRPIPPQFDAVPGLPQMFNAIRNQVEALQPHTLILCSEAFSNFGQVGASLIQRLLENLPEAEELQVYCALRRPDTYLMSWHGQRLKVGEKAGLLQENGLAQYFDGIHFNYRTLLAPWLEEIEPNQLILRNYADILAEGGSTEDFAKQTGLKLPENLTQPTRANPSLPRSAYSIMYHANDDLSDGLAHQLSVYLQRNGKALSPVKDADVELFGAEQRAKMRRKFAPIHRYLAEIAGRPSFFPDISAVGKVLPVPEHDAGRQLLDALLSEDLPNEEIANYVKQLQQKF